MSPLLFLALLLAIALSASADVVNGQQNCSCGFLDTQTGDFYTESIVIYFNETTSLPNDFVVEDFTHTYEKDWNAVYREAADPENVRINKTDSLQLAVQPPKADHVVKGASLRTARRDIQHGSFRTLIKSPRAAFSGSAMSMMLRFNESQSTELSIMNQDRSSNAWVGTFVENEFPTRDLGVNYTQLLSSLAANRYYTTLSRTLKNGSIDAWDYVEYRIDWTKHHITFFVGGNLTRQILRKDNSDMPSVPAPFFLKHWSTGSRFSMEGPPRSESVANVGWVRLFFNSSAMSEHARNDFSTRCSLTEACSMEDIQLRGSSPYTEDATQPWRQTEDRDIKRMPALWVSIGCLVFSTFLIVHTIIRRFSQPKAQSHGSIATAPTTISSKENEKMVDAPLYTHQWPRGLVSDLPKTSSAPSSSFESVDDLAIEKIEPSSCVSSLKGSTPGGPFRAGSMPFDSQATTPRTQSLFAGSTANNTREQLYSPSASTFNIPFVPSHTADHTLTAMAVSSGGPEDKIRMETVTESALPAPRMKPQPAPQRQRIDHLAGLTALCSIFVTIMHFGLTFVPAIVIQGAPQHARSESWAQRIIAPFLLNQMWLGVFFTTSVRFLAAPYLRRGKMEDVAKAAVRRTPRLIVPVACIAMLEYFMIDVGATSYLRYIPSLTWSTWPYVTRYENFGQFVSEVLELVYLIPNAAPQITLHYCTGVLWTIAVQLQGSWIVLLGVVVVSEMKTGWKRMAFYAFCIVNNWYANSWGAYFWLGLLLTDLDVTYGWKQYLATRSVVYYPLIIACWICVALGFGVNALPNWTNPNIAILEYGIHPEPTTGEPIMNTSSAGYPEYYIPRLNGLLFAGGMQAVVELSSAVQWLLSTPPLLVLFPHIFTIYLLHGLVFWTWGSWLLVFLADRGFSYSVNVAVVGVTSYAVLFLCLPIMTPTFEALGKDLTNLIWTSAIEKSPPRRATLFPFPSDLLTGRAVNKPDGKESDIEAGVAMGNSTASSTHSKESGFEKQKAKAQIEIDVKESKSEGPKEACSNARKAQFAGRETRM